jgi:hypothetical protein
LVGDVVVLGQWVVRGHRRHSLAVDPDRSETLGRPPEPFRVRARSASTPTNCSDVDCSTTRR